MRLPVAVGIARAKALVRALVKVSCFAAATVSRYAAAEADPCERDADVDAQMACYVARYCTDVDTDAARADCYSKVIRTLLAVPTTGPPAPMPEPSTEAPSASVGKRSQPSDEIPQEFRAHVSGIVPRAHGLRFIKLDNAQVWEEIERSRSRIETGDEVRIVRSRFNSYRLYPPNGGMVRVRRLVCDAHPDEGTSAKCRSLQQADG